jgi:PncC family amidohydrolase
VDVKNKKSFQIREKSMVIEEKIVQALKNRNYTITTAESCTGGLLAGRILNVSGASAVYNEGHITYSNEAKERLLGVSHDTLEQYGAVSEQTAAEMALGAARVANANVGLSTTGIAGPGGGSDSKPVGLVWIGVSSQKGTETLKMVFKGDRKRNMERFAASALDTLRKKLINELTD